MPGFFADLARNMVRSVFLVSYLLRFWELLLITFLKLDWVPQIVSAEERISRFVFSERHMNRTKGQIKPAAFLPSPKNKSASVLRTSDCPERRIWRIGELFVARFRTDRPKLLARGDLRAEVVLKQGLGIVADPSPHPRHADVTNWPEDRAQQKIKAMVLAQSASLLLHPRSN